MYICEECNSTNVEQRCWVKLNIPEIEIPTNITWASEGEINDNWCSNCQEHVRLLWEEDFDG